MGFPPLSFFHCKPISKTILLQKKRTTSIICELLEPTPTSRVCTFGDPQFSVKMNPEVRYNVVTADFKHVFHVYSFNPQGAVTRIKCINRCKVTATGSGAVLTGSGLAVMVIPPHRFTDEDAEGGSQGACSRSHNQEMEKTECKPSLSSQRAQSVNIHLLCPFPAVPPLRP